MLTKEVQVLEAECAILLLDYAFNHLNMQKVYCEVFEANTNALNAYKKFGFVEEGKFLNHIYKNGKFETVIRWLFSGIRPMPKVKELIKDSIWQTSEEFYSYNS